MDFSKGHGTENDFVVLPDLDVRLDLTVPRVKALCDRRRGLGADGVLRVAKAGALAEAGVLADLPDGTSADDWFMDYRNADGSLAEMCGNGVRVFAHYLLSTGLETRDEFVVGSRAGGKPVVVHSAAGPLGEVTVDMGKVRDLGSSAATLDGKVFNGIGIDVGNPHLACVDPHLTAASLSALDLTAAPGFDPGFFPHGVNVEILTRIDSGAVDMRVHERGVGETRSCGTGTVAAATAALRHEGADSGEVIVRIPGGQVTVSLSHGRATLRGPSVLVASGTVDDSWWNALT
ncbi:diaminopimelate epimerase [Rhodococcus oxybenzonivorans]|uniref:diaminopimelate epimerase n=1 Tax=Rhodococcus TaxID=1827 RepID=UPI00131FD5CF|nr:MULTISPECIES: diaminopimelate epimerase [Rhodococcus]MDV7352330.1 diaminopimelate epimerase [Rhodococcus oxybenzonivorans]QHE72240.1 Diaminopimelate epimerase [Rhodococcus sp. WAY2]